ncbi:MAG: LacI family DNA-binding transcriptional regulator [Acidimicrobiales bacterium]
MGVTIEQVAQRAGVSVATVSRALRGLENVAASTRARVRQAATDLDYRPDPHAARLASGHTKTIGLAAPLVDSRYIAQIVSGAEAVLAEEGFDLLIFTMRSQRSFSSSAGNRDLLVDGMILVDVGPDFRSQFAVDTAAVTVGLQSDNLSSVSIDNGAASLHAMAHLLDLGHRRIALLAGPESNDPSSAPQLRRRGYEQAMQDAGCFDPELVVDGAFTLTGAAEATRHLLALENPPTALFALSDEMAIAAISVLRESGVRVPEDMSVVGFDDLDLAEVLGLTTVRQPMQQLGVASARLLLGELERGGGEPKHQLFETSLVIRGTTAPCRSVNS